MPVSLEGRVKRLTAVVLSQGARLSLQDTAIRSLLVTHPRPARLRAAFESAGTGLVDRAGTLVFPKRLLKTCGISFKHI